MLLNDSADLAMTLHRLPAGAARAAQNWASLPERRSEKNKLIPRVSNNPLSVLE